MSKKISPRNIAEFTSEQLRVIGKMCCFCSKEITKMDVRSGDYGYSITKRRSEIDWHNRCIKNSQSN